MSSHHIIRDKQEPALYIHQLSISPEDLGQLLEWSPTLMVPQSIYENIVALGLKVDIVIVENPDFSALQEHTLALPIAHGHALETAIQYLIRETYPAVTLLAQQPDLDLLAQYQSLLTLIFLCGKEKTYAIKSGFSVWKPAGTLFKIATAPPIHQLHISHTQRKNNSFEVAQDGFICFTFESAFLIITEIL